MKFSHCCSRRISDASAAHCHHHSTHARHCWALRSMRPCNAPAISCSKHSKHSKHNHLTSMCAFAVAVAVSAGYSLATAFCSGTQDSCRHVQLPGASHAEQASVAAVEHVSPSVHQNYWKEADQDAAAEHFLCSAALRSLCLYDRVKSMEQTCYSCYRVA
jgi:hypothetical protein